MADTLFQAASFNERVGGGTTTYWYPVGSTGYNTTEAPSQIIFHSAGALRSLLVRLDTNSVGGGNTSTITLRKDGVNGNLSVSIPGNTTGDFEDDTSIDTIEDGSKICYRVVAGGSGGIIEVYLFRCLFTRDEETVTRLAATTTEGIGPVGKAPYSTASTTFYDVLCGFRHANTTEANVEGRQRKPGTFRNFAVYVSDNGRSTTSTARLRVNNANSTITTSIGAGLTGLFEDTTNTVAVVAGDDANYSFTTGTGTGDVEVESFALDFVSEDFTGIYMSGNTVQEVDNNDDIRYVPLMGVNTGSLGEASVKAKSGFVYADYKELTILVSQNNLDGTSTLKFRKNGVNGNLSISIPANTTGLFTDTGDVIDAALPDDEVNLQRIAGSGLAGDTITITYTLIWGFIVPLKRQQSLTMPTVIEDYNLNQQSHFFGHQSAMFGD